MYGNNLTPFQKDVYFEQALNPTATLYNLLTSFELPLHVDKSRLKHAVARVVSQIEILNSVVVEKDNDLVFYKKPLPSEALWKEIRFEEKAELKALEEKYTSLQYDLAEGPLFRVVYVYSGSASYLWLAGHHVQMDGTSYSNLMRLIVEAYHTPKFSCQQNISELLNYQNKLLTPNKQQKCINYWCSIDFETFGDVFDVPDKQIHSTKTLTKKLTPQQWKCVEILAKEQGVSVYQLLICIFALCIKRVFGQSQFSIGNVTRNRGTAKSKEMLGMMSSIFPVTFDTRGNIDVFDLARDTAKQFSQSYRFQKLPLSTLIQSLPEQKKPFDILFNYMNLNGDFTIEGEAVFSRYISQADASLPLTVDINDFGGSNDIECDVHFDTSLIQPNLAHHLLTIFIDSILNVSEKNRHYHNVISIDDQCLSIAKGTGDPDLISQYPNAWSLIAKSITKSPQSIALSDSNTRISYEQLAVLVDCASKTLLSKLPEQSVIGVNLPKGIQQVVAMLACFKANMIFVAMDPAQDNKRLFAIDEALHPALILSADWSLSDTQQMNYEQLITAVQQLNICTESNASVSDTAFILFTSGTTNKPKAVVMPHKGLISLILGQQHLSPELLNISRCLQFTSINFDVAVQEVLTTLYAGGELVCVSEQTRTSLDLLLGVIVQNKIDTLFLPNTVMSQLLSFALEQSYSLDSLKLIVTAGEALVVEKNITDFFKSHPHCRLINHYGPTETHVATGYNLGKEVETWVERPPIGVPLGFAQVAIINPLGEVAIKGLSGELIIAGEGLADGYWRQPAMTESSFVRNENVFTGKAYKSGDICRMSESGNIDYLTRAQQQVKVNGIRIDLSEVASVSKSVIGDRRVEVLQLPNTSSLVLAIEGGVINEQNTLKQLAELLPHYMCPKQVVCIDSFPTNINKKLDKTALLGYFTSQNEACQEIENKALFDVLKRSWQKVLDVEKITQSSSFFDLGGHSLSATRLVSIINKAVSAKFQLKHVFSAPTLIEQYLLLKNFEVTTDDFQNELLANSQQIALWRYQQLNPKSCEYNLSSVYQLNDEIDIEKLKRAIDITISAYPLLNAVFLERDGKLNIEKADKTTHWQTISNVEFTQKVDEFLQLPFDLAVETPFKAAVFEAQDQTYLGLSFHHIAIDNRSLSLFKAKLNEHYIMLLNDELLEVPQTLFHQLQYSNSDKTLSHWQERLSDMSGNVSLTPEFRLGQRSSGKYVDRDVSELIQQIFELSKRYQLSGSLCWEAIFAYVTRIYTQTSSINVGAPISLVDADSQGVGYFVNTLPTVYQFELSTSIAGYFEQAKSARLQDLAHCDVDISALTQRLDIQTNDGLFNLFVQWLDSDPVTFKLADTTQKLIKTPDISRFNFAASLINDSECASVQIDYNASLYSKGYIKLFVERIKLVTSELLRSSDLDPIGQIDYLLPCERTLIHSQFITHPKYSHIMVQFWKMVELYSERTAISFQGTDYSYAWLSKKVKQLSHILEQNNIAQGQHIIVAMERTPMALVCQLAIWQQGLVYVPLLKSLPEQRKQFIVNKVQPALILHDNHDSYGFSDVIVTETSLNMASESATQLKHHDVAYVLFTSGSTGEPKGVSVKHEGLAALLNGLISKFEVTHKDVMPSLGDLTFGVAFVECLLPLVSGGQCLMIPSNIQTDMVQLIPALEKSTLIHFIPALARVVAQSKSQKSLSKVRYIFVGGDALNCALVSSLQEVFNWAEIVEFYGQTEGTVLSSYCFSKQMLTYQDSDNIIGEALPHASLYVLDKQLKPVPFGVTGDLYIGGLGVAKGYFDNTELTNKYFIEVNDLGALFHTGDRAKYTLSGHIQYLGREDFQINVNGYRIEPAEIEAALKRVSGSDICVVKWHEEQQVLAAYHLPIETSEQVIKQRLAVSLPSYMIPHRFIELQQFPLNRNNKVDRKALELPLLTSKQGALTPKTTAQTKLFDLWQAVFDVPVNSLEDSFFDTGAHSLKAAEFVSHFNKTFNAEISLANIFQQPQIGQLLPYLSATNTGIVGAEIQRIPQQQGVMSAAQQRIWMLHKFDPQNSSYDKNIHLVLHNSSNAVRVQSALIALVNRHESLRTIFPDSDTQKIISKPDDLISTWYADSASECDDLVARVKDKLTTHRFDLTHEVPFCADVVVNHESKEVHILLKTHHVVTDGVSMQILAKDLFTAYKEGTLPGESIRYLDFSVWHRGLQIDQALKSFWQKYLSDAPYLHELPLDSARTSHQQTLQGELITKVKSELIRDLAQSLQVTQYELLLSTFGYVLNRFANQQDICISTPYHGRELPELSGVVGCFINTVITRIQQSKQQSFAEFITSASHSIRAARDNANIGLEGLIELLEPPRNTSAMPLSQILFNFQSGLETQLSEGELHLSANEFGEKHSTYDLSLAVNEAHDNVEFTWQYNQALFNELSIQHIAKALEYLLSKLPSVLSEPCESFNFVDIKKRSEAHVKSWLEVVSERLIEYADDVVVADKKSMFTGRGLLKATTVLSNNISNTVPLGSAIAVSVTKSCNSVIGLLASQFAGCIYVPIDPSLPKERQAHILQDADVKLVLSDSDFVGDSQLSAFKHINIEALSAVKSSDDLLQPRSFATSYYLYTSGSTGQPKGVAIEQTALSAFLNGASNRLGIAPYNVLSVTTSSFDISILEMLLPLYSGGFVYLANSEEVELGSQVQQLCKDKAINLIQTTPSRWKSWLSSGLHSLNEVTLLTGGEALPSNLANQLKALSEDVYNCYGPTEATIWSMMSRLPEQHNEILISQSIDNYHHLVVNHQQASQPIGAKGELVIGGLALAKEYVNLQAQTDEKFVLLAGGNRAYKSGDLVQQRTSDSYRFLGRTDNQVKLRGYRIELSEIESVIYSHTSLSEVAVKVINENLVCYFNQLSAEPTEHLKDCIKQALPSYMVPEIWVGLDAFPYNSAGKIDYQALPKPDLISHNDYVEAKSQTEIQLLEMWRAILEKTELGIEHNFFDVGGNSLLAVNLVNLINETYGVSLSVKSVFDAPTVAMQSALIDALSVQEHDTEYEEEGFL